jgi:hypothetical protein
LGLVWTGALSIPNAPSTANFNARILGQIWSIWAGGLPGGPVQAFSGETLTINATGLNPSTAYNALWQGISEEESTAIPAAPTVVQSGAANTFYPPQTPPPTGFNSFTDNSGRVWVSYNGSAWATANGNLISGVFGVPAGAIPGNPTKITWTSVYSDVYHMFQSNNTDIIVPIAGWWSVTLSLGATANVAGNALACQVLKNNTISMMIGNVVVAQAAGNVMISNVSGMNVMNIGTVIAATSEFGAGIPAYGVGDINFLLVQYMGA